MKKSKELKDALRLVTKVQVDSRLGPGQGDMLRKAKRELEAVARSGKFDEVRTFRAIQMIATVLTELLANDAAP